MHRTRFGETFLGVLTQGSLLVSPQAGKIDDEPKRQPSNPDAPLSRDGATLSGGGGMVAMQHARDMLQDFSGDQRVSAGREDA